MYTRTSVSRDIAEDIMSLSAARGHTLADCGIKENILNFLAGNGSASTLDGWIKAAQEYKHDPSFHVMGFIYIHDYLRELFPDDVIDDFVRLAMREDYIRLLISYIARGKSLLPFEVECCLHPVPSEMFDVFERSSHFRSLRLDF